MLIITPPAERVFQHDRRGTESVLGILYLADRFNDGICIADRVAMNVVHALEVVEVEQDQMMVLAGGAAGPPILRQLPRWSQYFIRSPRRRAAAAAAES